MRAYIVPDVSEGSQCLYLDVQTFQKIIELFDPKDATWGTILAFQCILHNNAALPLLTAREPYWPFSVYFRTMQPFLF
jgi:hypothetical protein